QRASSLRAVIEKDRPSTCSSMEKRSVRFVLPAYALVTLMAPAVLFPPPLLRTLPKEKRLRTLLPWPKNISLRPFDGVLRWVQVTVPYTTSIAFGKTED